MDGSNLTIGAYQKRKPYSQGHSILLAHWRGIIPNFEILEQGYFLRQDGNVELFPSRRDLVPSSLTDRLKQLESVTVVSEAEETIMLSGGMLLTYSKPSEAQIRALLLAVK